MTERVSKTKYDEQGNHKHYFAHSGPDGKLCFGIGKAPAGELQDTVEEINEKEETEKVMEENAKDLEGLFEESTKDQKDEADDSPMSKAEWKEKDFRIVRLTLAKTFIGASVDFDNAVINDLDKWTSWVITGKHQ